MSSTKTKRTFISVSYFNVQSKQITPALRSGLATPVIRSRLATPALRSRLATPALRSILAKIEFVQ